MDKAKTLTWGDAEQYYRLGGMPGVTPDLPPERLALVEEDVKLRKSSLVVEYMLLRTIQQTRASARFEAKSPADQLRHVRRVRDRLSDTHPDAGKDFDVPLAEKVEELKQQLGIQGSPFDEPADGDRREKPGYDRGEAAGEGADAPHDREAGGGRGQA